MNAQLQYMRIVRTSDALRRIMSELEIIRECAWKHLGPVEENPEVDDKLATWAGQTFNDVDRMIGDLEEHAERNLRGALKAP